jgi:hypothetical protein
MTYRFAGKNKTPTPFVFDAPISFPGQNLEEHVVERIIISAQER